MISLTPPLNRTLFASAVMTEREHESSPQRLQCMSVDLARDLIGHIARDFAAVEDVTHPQGGYGREKRVSIEAVVLKKDEYESAILNAYYNGMHAEQRRTRDAADQKARDDQRAVYAADQAKRTEAQNAAEAKAEERLEAALNSKRGAAFCPLQWPGLLTPYRAT